MCDLKNLYIYHTLKPILLFIWILIIHELVVYCRDYIYIYIFIYYIQFASEKKTDWLIVSITIEIVNFVSILKRRISIIHEFTIIQFKVYILSFRFYIQDKEYAVHLYTYHNNIILVY